MHWNVQGSSLPCSQLYMNYNVAFNTQKGSEAFKGWGMDRISAPISQQGRQDRSLHQTSSQTLSFRLEHPLSSVPVWSFPKDWWHLEVTVVWQFEALISGLILIASWNRAPPIVLSNPPLCHWSPCTEWAFPFGMLRNSLQPFTFPPWAAWPLG